MDTSLGSLPSQVFPHCSIFLKTRTPKYEVFTCEESSELSDIYFPVPAAPEALAVEEAHVLIWTHHLLHVIGMLLKTLKGFLCKELLPLETAFCKEYGELLHAGQSGMASSYCQGL